MDRAGKQWGWQSSFSAALPSCPTGDWQASIRALGSAAVCVVPLLEQLCWQLFPGLSMEQWNPQLY